LARSVDISFFLKATALLCLAEPALAEQPDGQSDTELLSEARRAREAGDFDRAEQLACEGVAGSRDPVWPLTLALVLTDKGNCSEALGILAAP